MAGTGVAGAPVECDCKETAMGETAAKTLPTDLIVDFIISLDGYASAEGWPGWWGVESPTYLAWLDERPDRDDTILMGANTYRVMSGFATSAETPENEAAAIAELTRRRKVVFSS